MSGLRRAPAPDPDAARREARKILSDRRFHPGRAPKPFRGPLEWIGDRLRGIFNWLGDVFSHVPLPLLFLAVAALVALVAWRIALAVSRRRVTRAKTRGDASRRQFDDREDPDALDRAADAAERAGDLDTALRLRFRAGLLRLGSRGAITYRPSVTTGEVRRTLGSDTFDDLAETFENVAYGGQHADAPAVEHARREWPRVLDEVRSR